MPTVLIIYYSRSGNTAKMAEYVREAVVAEGCTAVMKPVAEVDVADLLEPQGIIVGSPTYYGGMAAEIKQLIDKSVKYHGKLAGKVGGAFSSAGNIGGGNETTVRSILDALLIHGMIVQGTPKGDHYGPVAIGAPDERSETCCRELGSTVGRLVNRLFG